MTKATIAKNRTVEEEEKEQIKLAYGAVLANKLQDGDKTVSKLELEKELNNLNAETTIKDNSDESMTVTFLKTQNSYTIDSKGNINGPSKSEGDTSTTPEKQITASDIASSTDKSKYYGAIVNGYNLNTINGKDYNNAVANWKIFYADENNIYLIADDYIHYDYCPPSTTQVISKNTDYQFSMSNIIKDYPNGSSHITDQKIKALNKKYLYESTNNNMKAVAYMLDTEVWNVYVGEKAEYAIGGPTIEMLTKSYNQKYKHNYIVRANDKIGYQISEDNGTVWNDSLEIYPNNNDELYEGIDVQKSSAMWLASPSAGGSDCVMAFLFHGANEISFSNCSNNYNGFRPLVCLKSEVYLKMTEDGNYNIQ